MPAAFGHDSVVIFQFVYRNSRDFLYIIANVRGCVKSLLENTLLNSPLVGGLLVVG